MKFRSIFQFVLILAVMSSCQKNIQVYPGNFFRAPATPLITIDPYTSIWSFGDGLNEQPTLHWTGTPHPLNGLIRVDGEVYRFLGSGAHQEVISGKELEGAQKYTIDKPSEVWMMPGYDDSLWMDAEGPVGSADFVKDQGTYVDADTVWIRKRVMLDDLEGLKLRIHADDAYIWRMVIYLNGEPLRAVSQCNYKKILPLEDGLSSKLREGVNFLGIYLQRRNSRQKVYAHVDFIRDVGPQLAEQTSSLMTATKSSYGFTCGGVDLQVDFLAPLLMEDLDLLSRPANYISFNANSNDGEDHDIQVYLDASPLIAVDQPHQEVVWEEKQTGDLKYLKTGTASQPVLEKMGDNVRIDWGYLLLCPQVGVDAQSGFVEGDHAYRIFMEKGILADAADRQGPKRADSAPVLAASFDLGSVGSKAESRYVILAYEDEYAIEYFGEPLRAWWKRDGMETTSMLRLAAEEYETLVKGCADFDNQLYEEACKAGGEAYANLCVLAYRQALAAHKLVADPDGFPLFFSKENFSNGSIGTVDVTYPSAPLFLLYGPDLLKGMLEPIFCYSESGKWTKPIAAHDVGKYPRANGQLYPEDMPVEECGNMIILTAAIGEVEQDYSYAERHWETLTTWAAYLKEKGFDPENQLCTDDFAGHLAHNANLSIKAIVALGAYARMADNLGKAGLASEYRELAQTMVPQWMEASEDGDHYSLTFDRKDTWSQKYNLVWDRLLGLNLFPGEVVQKEMSYYLSKQNRYGLPLDSRAAYTKSDWILWTAAMTDDPETFKALVDPVYLYATTGLNREPLSDWHDTKTGWVMAMRARSVVGGYYMKVLADRLKK